MEITEFSEALLSYLAAVPAAALCFFPVKNQLRHEPRKLLRYALPVILPRVWYTTVILSVLFLSVNLLIRPLQYQTLYTNNLFLAFWGILSMMLSTLLLLTVIFYFIVSGLIKKMETEEKNRLLEMRESQYVKQQRYLEATAEERHNFRQTIRTLENLSREDDNTAIRKYLSDYVSAMPKNDVVSFCTNQAVNALLNYYAESAENLGADMDWHS